MKHNLYEGQRQGRAPVVLKNGKPFSPRRSLLVRNHSPGGFEWGYAGSGPAQLALAILLEETDQETAQRHCQHFKREVVAHLDQEDQWTLTSERVSQFLKAQQPPVESQGDAP